jgi:hypothetical protein
MGVSIQQLLENKTAQQVIQEYKSGSFNILND